MNDKDYCEAHGLFRPCGDCAEQGVIEIGLHDDLQADYDLLKGDYEALEAELEKLKQQLGKEDGGCDRDGVYHGPRGNNPRHPLDMD